MKKKYTAFYLDSPIIPGRGLDIFEPAPGKATGENALFFVHGGGWRSGSRQSYHPIMEAFTERGFITASTGYRLNAENAFEQLTDIRESFDAFAEYLMEKGRSPKIVVHGTSAGAHLASLLACARPGECGEDISKIKHPEVRPSSAILQSTPYDFLPYDWRIPAFWSSMCGIAGVPYEKSPETYERLSLKNYIRSDNPPIFFMEAELEHLFPIDLTLKIAKEQRQMNIPAQWKVYKRMEHGFFFELKREGQKEAFEDMCSHLKGDFETQF